MENIIYEEITSITGSLIIKATYQDGTIWFIPNDVSNSDYQAYLATLASELSNPSTPQAGE